MKTIAFKTSNQNGIEKIFTVSASHNKGNFYALKIKSEIEIEGFVNGHAGITNEGSIRNYTIGDFKLKKNSVSQIVITPKGGSKKDRFTIQIDNNDLI